MSVTNYILSVLQWTAYQRKIAHFISVCYVFVYKHFASSFLPIVTCLTLFLILILHSKIPCLL